VFALHPIQVESVAWISEQKNTLSTVFALSSAHLYWRFADERRWPLYAWASVLFGCGLLTKTVVGVLPVALLILVWSQRGTLSVRRDGLPLAPWLVLGAVAGLMTAAIERNLLGAEGVSFDLTAGQRMLSACRALTFYVGKSIWPAELLFIYPRVVADVANWMHYVPVGLETTWLAVRLAVVRRWRGPLAALLLYVCLLVPALGFVNVYPFTFSFVADHIQYAASLGIFAFAAATITMGLQWLFAAHRAPTVVFQAALLALLGALTWRQSETWTSNATLFARTLEANPRCHLCANNLGVMAWEARKPDVARARFADAVAIAPDPPEAHGNLANVLASSGAIAQAIEHYEKSLALAPATWRCGPISHSCCSARAAPPKRGITRPRRCASCPLSPRRSRCCSAWRTRRASDCGAASECVAIGLRRPSKPDRPSSQFPDREPLGINWK
jgi:protein O-mannosyl-transferase